MESRKIVVTILLEGQQRKQRHEEEHFGHGGEEGGMVKRMLIHVDVWQKPSQYCTVTTL